MSDLVFCKNCEHYYRNFCVREQPENSINLVTGEVYEKYSNKKNCYDERYTSWKQERADSHDICGSEGRYYKLKIYLR